jgi:hypothetical protein
MLTCLSYRQGSCPSAVPPHPSDTQRPLSTLESDATLCGTPGGRISPTGPLPLDLVPSAGLASTQPPKSSLPQSLVPDNATLTPDRYSSLPCKRGSFHVPGRDQVLEVTKERQEARHAFTAYMACVYIYFTHRHQILQTWELVRIWSFKTSTLNRDVLYMLSMRMLSVVHSHMHLSCGNKVPHNILNIKLHSTTELGPGCLFSTAAAC